MAVVSISKEESIPQILLIDIPIQVAAKEIGILQGFSIFQMGLQFQLNHSHKTVNLLVINLTVFHSKDLLAL